MGCLGGSGQTTDRKATLSSYGSLESLIGQLKNTGTGLVSQGSADTGRASKYFSDILSGDPSKVLEAAAPEVHAITSQADQQKKEISQFGNRTGGTNAITANIGTDVRGKIADVISSKRGEAAGAEAKIGAGETGAGLTALDSSAGTAASLASISGRNRALSQQIHTDAVNNWINAVNWILNPNSQSGAPNAV